MRLHQIVLERRSASWLSWGAERRSHFLLAMPSAAYPQPWFVKEANRAGIRVGTAAVEAADHLLGNQPSRAVTFLTDKAVTNLMGSVHSRVLPQVPNARSIYSAQLGEKLQGLGLGRKMYGNAIRDAFEKFKGGQGPRYFTSDAAVSNQAGNLWEALTRRGYPVQKDFQVPGAQSFKPQYGIDLDAMKNFYGDGAKAAHLNPWFA